MSLTRRAFAAVAQRLRRPQATPPPTVPGAELPADHRQLGCYRIERRLGRGSMGSVFLGRDMEQGVQVAVKTLVLGREFHGEALAEARRRFFREAETAARLRHPDIVSIVGSGEEGDLAYIAMEYVEGRDLLPYTRPGELLDVAAVVAIGARVAEALAHAHRQGVVHRDVKPANVLVDLRAGVVKVTDFGIARVADASRTRTGMLLGTPSFMSPEQMAGGRLDGRSDLYSLGVMLFQLLTGALPHDSPSMATLMRQIAHTRAPSVCALRPELAPELGAVIARALEKRPEARHADGTELAAALRAALPRPTPGAVAAAP